MLLDLSVRFIYTFMSSVYIVGVVIGRVGVVAVVVKLEANSGADGL